MGARQTNRRVPIVAALLCAAAFLAAGVGARTLTDDLGRPVEAPDHPARILTYAPNLTETVFAIGAADRLVGRTRFCDWPPEASKVPSFGGLLDPDFEKIAALRPDLILATTAGDPRDKVDALSRLGYPVFVTSPGDVGDVIADIESIGAAVGAERDAARVAAGMRAELADVARRVGGRARVRTLVVIWQDPLRTIGNGSFLADVLRRAGGEPVPGGGDADYPQVNMEAVLHAAPEVILLGRPGEPGRGEEDFWRQFKTLPAVRDGRILSVDLEVASRPGPRIAGAVREIARALHPDAFDDAPAATEGKTAAGAAEGARP